MERVVVLPLLLPLPLLLLLLLSIVTGKDRSVRTKGRRLTSEHVPKKLKGTSIIAVTGYAH